MERIAFFVSSPFHGAMLDPILECCRKSHFECLRSDGLAEIARFQPRAVVHASKIDRDFRREFPETFHIWVRHGFASKNFGKQSVARADIACMPSLWSLMEYRRRGLMGLLLAGAVDHARENGAAVVEAYPVNIPDDMSGSAGYMGLKPAFEKAGFEEVARPSERQSIMRYSIR